VLGVIDADLNDWLSVGAGVVCAMSTAVAANMNTTPAVFIPVMFHIHFLSYVSKVFAPSPQHAGSVAKLSQAPEYQANLESAVRIHLSPLRVVGIYTNQIENV
jgi:hypothetical protein